MTTGFITGLILATISKVRSHQVAWSQNAKKTTDD